MSLEATACAIAAREMGYPSFAEVIRDRKLPPSAVADLLGRHATSKDGMVVAVVVLAAGTARHMTNPDGWNGETERLLALDALANKASFTRAAKKAAQIVAQHWQEIASKV